MYPISYSQMMQQSGGHLTITVENSEPIEIGDFAAMFAGMGKQFDDYIRTDHPKLKGQARMYVREVRPGSTIADLFPQIADMIGIMDATLIVLGFGALFSKRIRRLITGQFLEGATKSDLQAVADTIKASAHDKDGTTRLESIVYEEDGPKKRLEASFTGAEARKALETIEAQKKALDGEEAADHARVLMIFTRPDIYDAEVGKRSGERVKIEEISPKHLALMYGSEIAEQRIKSEIRDTETSIFAKGFVVDVNVQTRGGKPVAYSVTNLHEVLDLPED